jgi:hypothetical protein
MIVHHEEHEEKPVRIYRKPIIPLDIYYLRALHVLLGKYDFL